MRELYCRYELLCDECADLEDMIDDLKHILSLGHINRNDYRRNLYEDELAETERMLTAAEDERAQLANRIEDYERADFERMTL